MAKFFGNTGGAHKGQSGGPAEGDSRLSGLPEGFFDDPFQPEVPPDDPLEDLPLDTPETGRPRDRGAEDTKPFILGTLSSPPEGGTPPGRRQEPPGQPPEPPEKKRRWPLRVAIVAGVLAAMYLIFVFAPIGPIRRLRNAYLETALSTMSHQWLATAFFPGSVVDEVRQQMKDAINDQTDLSSQWGTPAGPDSTVPNPPPALPPEDLDTLPPELLDDPYFETFFSDFYQLDQEETLQWAADNMDLLSGGWENLKVSEAGTDQDGLPIHTTRGDQVLAIDVPNGVLLIRVKGTGYRGVLAIAKDPSRLSLRPSANIGETGQNAGSIASRYDGVLAMTASGFIDEEGHGSGGILTGFARCAGEDYGTHFSGGYRRIEKHADNLLYITSASSAVSDRVTDAMEFTPALIVDGEIVVDDRCGWTAFNPRAILGQSDQHEIMMLVIEGRLPTVSLGISVVTCAEILADYHCMQAMNMDGGTSAILWYDGTYVTLCSNTALSAGRMLPNAWVYAKAEED